MHKTFAAVALGVLIAMIAEPFLAKLVNPLLAPLKLAV
jgi:hypothetical protein